MICYVVLTLDMRIELDARKQIVDFGARSQSGSF